MCHAQGFEQTTMDDYLYGPFYNDLTVEPIDETVIGTFLKEKCNESLLGNLHDAFFSPGVWRTVTTDKDLNNVVTCAWKGKKGCWSFNGKIGLCTTAKTSSRYK